MNLPRENAKGAKRTATLLGRVFRSCCLFAAGGEKRGEGLGASALVAAPLNRPAATFSPRCAKGEGQFRIRERGALQADLLVAMAILAVAMLPLSAGFFAEQKVLRSHYWRAVAMEIVDGEMEILVAGEWRARPEGTQPYLVKADAAKNLPPGKFTLTRTGKTLRLEWAPEKGGSGGAVVREAVAR